MDTLTANQKSALRRLAHNLQPIVHIGRQGITPNLLQGIDQALEAHELIKLKFQDFQDQKQALLETVSETVPCSIVAVIGNIAILYRQNPAPERRKVHIPIR